MCKIQFDQIDHRCHWSWESPTESIMSNIEGFCFFFFKQAAIHDRHKCKSVCVRWILLKAAVKRTRSIGDRMYYQQAARAAKKRQSKNRTQQRIILQSLIDWFKYTCSNLPISLKYVKVSGSCPSRMLWLAWNSTNRVVVLKISGSDPRRLLLFK